MNQIILVTGFLYLSLLWSMSLKTGEIDRAVRTSAAISSLLVTFSCRLVQPLRKRRGFELGKQQRKPYNIVTKEYKETSLKRTFKQK